MWTVALFLVAAPATVDVLVEGRSVDVEMTAYVAGVVEAELGAAPIEAQKALAIVVRTYAVHALAHPRHRPLALCDRAHCQVWRAAKTASAKRAAADTAGRVLVGPKGAPSPVFHHAACGGTTRDAHEVWPGLAAPWLIGVSDLDADGSPWCRGARRWRHEIRRDVLAPLLSKLVRRSLDPASLRFEAKGGRFLVGDARGTSRLPAHDVHVVLARARGGDAVRAPRFAVRTRGATFMLEGQGFGHLVGLCQHGAIRRALAGQTAEQILRAYFPKLKISEVPREL